MRSNFGKVVQNFELKRVGGAPKGYQITPLLYVLFKTLCQETSITLFGAWTPFISRPGSS